MDKYQMMVQGLRGLTPDPIQSGHHHHDVRAGRDLTARSTAGTDDTCDSAVFSGGRIHTIGQGYHLDGAHALSELIRRLVGNVSGTPEQVFD